VFYTALTYDGAEAWEPPHPADAAMLQAFHAHQAGDKGFGPAAGPGATAALRAAFEGAGYRVLTGDSPWRLGAADAALVGELATGAAAAVRETGRVPEGVVAEWLRTASPVRPARSATPTSSPFRAGARQGGSRATCSPFRAEARRDGDSAQTAPPSGLGGSSRTFHRPGRSARPAERQHPAQGLVAAIRWW
jgi:hypothetical protein